MRILTDLKQFTPDPGFPLILGIGNFDGLHIGHQKLLQHVLKQAQLKKGQSAVLTFQTHPYQVLHPTERHELLMSAEYKLFLLNEFGVDLCFWLPFTAEISNMRAAQFVSELLVGKLRVEEVCLGYNAHFGYQREGDPVLMQKFSLQHGFKFEKIDPVKAGGDYVSSSRIRSLVSEGKLEEAEICLGRPFSIIGKIIHGTGRGKSLGYPTANLEIQSDILPPVGIYPVMIRFLEMKHAPIAASPYEELAVKSKGPWLESVLSLGYRPTFRSEDGVPEKPIPEVFIFDFEGDLYGKTIEMFFYPRLREEQAFKDAEVLKKQIGQDVADARRFLRSLPKKTFTKYNSFDILKPTSKT